MNNGKIIMKVDKTFEFVFNAKAMTAIYIAVKAFRDRAKELTEKVGFDVGYNAMVSWQKETIDSFLAMLEAELK